MPIFANWRECWRHLSRRVSRLDLVEKFRLFTREQHKNFLVNKWISLVGCSKLCNGFLRLVVQNFVMGFLGWLFKTLLA